MSCPSYTLCNTPGCSFDGGHSYQSTLYVGMDESLPACSHCTPYLGRPEPATRCFVSRCPA